MTTAAASRILGVDYGERHTGLAISDDALRFAVPLATIEHTDAVMAADAIAQLPELAEIAAIVVGYPVNNAQEATAQTKKTDDFLAALRKRLPHLPVHTFDERHSTQAALAQMNLTEGFAGKRKQTKDKLAATVILQSYLDRQQMQQQKTIAQ